MDAKGFSGHIAGEPGRALFYFNPEGVDIALVREHLRRLERVGIDANFGRSSRLARRYLSDHERHCVCHVVRPGSRAPGGGRSPKLALRGSAGNSRTRATSRKLNAFVTGQVAFSTVLLVLAVLLGRTYLNTQSVDPGIDIQNTLAVSVDWSQMGSDRAKGRILDTSAVREELNRGRGSKAMILSWHPAGLLLPCRDRGTRIAPGGATASSPDASKNFTAPKNGESLPVFDHLIFSSLHAIATRYRPEFATS